MERHPDFNKVTVTAHYDDDDRCRTISVYLNDDNVTPEDVAGCVRALFRPGANTRPQWDEVTRSNYPVPLPEMRINGVDPLTSPISKPDGWF